MKEDSIKMKKAPLMDEAYASPIESLVDYCGPHLMLILESNQPHGISQLVHLIVHSYTMLYHLT